jgi:predicted DsbA family dithiol-disulfide isomerase
MDMSIVTFRNRRHSDPRRIWHWYDFRCPYCYLAQTRLAALRTAGLYPQMLPYPVPIDVGLPLLFDSRRTGSTRRLIERAARDAGLPLQWPTRAPDTRRALAVTEWVRRYQPDLVESLYRRLFEAQFAQGEDLGDPRLVDALAEQVGVDVIHVKAALLDGTADHAVAGSVSVADRYGVTGPPAWLIGEQVVHGLPQTSAFDEVMRAISDRGRPAARNIPRPHSLARE